MAQQYFITGTDTGVGKTVLSALLCAALGASYWKPIQTGAEEDSDSRAVQSLAELPAERLFPEAYKFAPPVSPHLAARLAGARIELAKIQLPAEIGNAPFIAALRNAGVAVAGVVMIGAPNAENRAAIEEYGKVRVVGEIPWLAEMNRSVLLEIFAGRFDKELFAPLARATTQS
jgi:dethiobiotin synthetase